MTIFIGVDASKGYGDFRFISEAGKELVRQRLDDSVSGRRRVINYLDAVLQQHQASREDVLFVFGAESSGGVEKNWLRFFRSLKEDGYRVLVHQLNPLVVRRLTERELHRRKTDEQDAAAIAEYLRGNHLGMREYSPHEAELRMAAQSLQSEITLGGAHRNQLQGLLVHVHPGLVQYCRSRIPTWILHLVTACPAAADLAQASPVELARIPYLTLQRAHELVEEARRTVAGSVSHTARFLVKSKAEAILRQDQVISNLEDHLEGLFGGDTHFQIMQTIPGVGPRTALWLRIVYGDFSTFRSSKAAVAYAGLDPTVEQSGDSIRNNRISKRGKGSLRAVLFMAAQTACRIGGPLKEFHDRLRGRGKTSKQALVAVMAKLIRIAYACVLGGQAYSLESHVQTVSRANAHRLAQRPSASSLCTLAPVSRREASRRKKAAAPSEVKPQVAGSTT